MSVDRFESAIERREQCSPVAGWDHTQVWNSPDNFRRMGRFPITWHYMELKLGKIHTHQSYTCIRASRILSDKYACQGICSVHSRTVSLPTDLRHRADYIAAGYSRYNYTTM